MGAVDQNVTALERAFQIAGSGNVATIDALKRQSRAEGYSAATITGKTLFKKLPGSPPAYGELSRVQVGEHCSRRG